MKAKKLIKYMPQMCEGGRNFLLSHTSLKQAWKECVTGTWMLWLLEQVGFDDHRLLFDTALALFEGSCLEKQSLSYNNVVTLMRGFYSGSERFSQVVIAFEETARPDWLKDLVGINGFNRAPAASLNSFSWEFIARVDAGTPIWYRSPAQINAEQRVADVVRAHIPFRDVKGFIADYCADRGEE